MTEDSESHPLPTSRQSSFSRSSIGKDGNEENPKRRKPSIQSITDSVQDVQSNAEQYAYQFSLRLESFYPSEETKAKTWYKIFEEICLSTSMIKTQKYLYKRGLIEKSMFYYIVLCIDVILRGIAQVFLCNHPICGILVLIGLGFTSFKLPLYALLGTALSTFSAATVARPPEEDILAGLCGYDGALVGCACLSFFGGVEETITATVLLSYLAGIVHVAVANLMKIWQVPCFTFAFNIVTIMIIFAVKGDNVKLRFAKSTPVHHSPNWTDMSFLFVVDASIRGVGQFMFADTTIGSSFVVAGIALCSRKGACVALLGSIVGWIVAYYILDTTNRVNIRSGLYGYNCAGTCCALAGGIFYPSSDGAVLVGICGAALAALLHQGIAGAFGGLPVLTFPFILSAWMLMLSRSKWLEVTSDGILRPLFRRISSRSTKFRKRKLDLDSFDNPDDIKLVSRLRSALQRFASSGKTTYNSRPTAPPAASHNIYADVVDKSSDDEKTLEDEMALSTTVVTSRDESKDAWKALVDMQRDMHLDEKTDIEGQHREDKAEED